MQRIYVYLALSFAVVFIIGRYLYERYARSLDSIYKEVCDELEKAIARLENLLGKVPGTNILSDNSLQDIVNAFDECAVIFGAYLHGVRVKKLPDLVIEKEDTIESLKKAVIAELKVRHIITSEEHEILLDLFKVAPFLDPALSDETKKNEPALFEKTVQSIPQYYQTMKTVMKKIEGLA